MALISTAISESAFEIVKKQIGAILVAELTNQKTLQGFQEPINVYVDRIANFQVSEELIINVRLENLNKSNHNQHSTHDEVTYNIDIISSGIQSQNDLGGTISSAVRDKFAALIAAILQSNIYTNLGLGTGLIMSSTVESFNTYEAANNQDSNFVSMGRISHSVRMYQDYKVWAGVDFGSNFTDIKLDLTDLGYKYVFTN